MQILKNEVRNRILEAALKEFAELGYEKSSLRQIAKQSGITAGNIYAYFKDKKALLDAILEPILVDFTSLIDDIASKNDNTQEYLHIVASRVVEIYHQYRLQVIILMTMMNDQKYSIYRQKFMDTIAKAIMNEVPCAMSEPLAQIIANSVVAGIITCFKDIPSLKEEEAIDLVYGYLHFMFHITEVK